MEIVRSGNFEVAARKLHVTPSAISQRIKQLEDQLGQVLIVRSNPCRATLTGQALLRHAEQIDMLESELFSTLEMPARQSLSVAVNADSIDGWFLDAMDDACHQSSILLISYGKRRISTVSSRKPYRYSSVLAPLEYPFCIAGGVKPERASCGCSASFSVMVSSLGTQRPLT